MVKKHSEPITYSFWSFKQYSACIESQSMATLHLIVHYNDLERALLVQELYGEPIFINDFTPNPKFWYT